jgi:glutamate-1-semialdehyde 2,1-aminomutase
VTAAVASGMRAAVAAQGLADYIEIHAAPWRIILVYRDADGAASQAMRTLMLQEMIGRNVLFQGFFLPCFEHTDADVRQVLDAFAASCAIYRHAIDHGMGDLLVGEPARPVFRKYVGCRQACPVTPCPLERQCRTGGQ